MKIAIWYNGTDSILLHGMLSKLNDFEFWGYLCDCITDIDRDNSIVNNYDNIQLIVVPAMEQFQYRKVIRFLYNQGVNYADKIYTTSVYKLEEKVKKNRTIEDIIHQNTIAYIPSIEYEVSKSCNLNCRRCNHFSNLQLRDTFGNFDSFSNDLIKIKEFIEEIGTIYLLGGEPLLNKELYKYIEFAHNTYASSQIVILSNGLLIQEMSTELIDQIKKHDVILGISFYPVVKNNKEKCEFLDKIGVKYYCFNSVNSFSSFINLKGDSDPHVQMHRCMLAFAHSFENGKMYKCCMSENISIFNKRFMTDLPEPYYCFEGKGATAKELKDFLLKPNELCRYCRDETSFPWEVSQGVITISDWCE